MKATELPPTQRILDQVFYRAVAGYFVCLSHPLVLLLATIVVAGLARTSIDLVNRGRARQAPAAEEAKDERRQRRRERARARESGPAFVRGFRATASLRPAEVGE